MAGSLNKATYEVELRLNDQLIGNIQELAQNLTWTRQRTKMGVDSISFTVNDRLFSEWCRMRGTTVGEILKPIALDCRVIRNGVPVVGGFLATMPAYQPSGTSANLQLKFDGYLNLLAGVNIYPQATNKGKMGDLIQQWITMADERAEAAGKAFGFTAGQIDDMASVEQSFENYTAVKDVIANRCDNTTGAGPFEVYFHPDRTYDVIKSENFGEAITDYIVQYPTLLNAVSATSLSAKELTGFASTVISIGGGEVSEDTEADTAIVSIQTNSEAVKEYGYVETVLQSSDISVQETLDRNTASELENRSTMQWQPELKLTGRMVSPSPTGSRRIWIGDTITLQNSQDYTGMTSGSFRVNSLQVAVAATGAETITPSLSRGEAINTNSFAKDIVRIRNELLNLKTAHAGQ